ncbi:MAG: hypothetical protein QM802_09110 [Agriterribacter sp.]
MILKYFTGVVLIVLLCSTGCRKDDNEIPGPVKDTAKRALVRSIEWDNGTTAIMEYNTDSNLVKIDYRFQNIVSTTVFNWTGKQFKEMYDDRSWYKNVFYYNGSNVSHYINTAREASIPTSYTMEYGYTPAGKLITLKHYSTDEAGTVLKASSQYQYNTQGELASVVTQSGNSVFTHVVESFSEEINFDPLIYIEPTLSENYTIYNLPVLSSAHKLPKKIIRKVKIGTAEEFVDKIEETVFETAHKRLNKITTTITIPGMPQYTNKISAVFRY